MHKLTILEDEDLAQELHLHLQSLNMKYLHALDIMDYMGQPDVMEQLNLKKVPSKQMAWLWMHAMRYQYGKAQNRMYMDGHKHANVMEYRKEVFLPFWMSIEGLMMKWNNENKPIEPTGIPVFPQH